MNFLYINNELSSVFSSQVVALLAEYRQSGKFDDIALLCGYRNQVEKNKLEQLLKSGGFATFFFKTFPNYPLFHLLQQYSISRAFKRFKGLKKNTVIHIRGEMAAMLSTPAIKKYFGNLDLTLVDIRGVAREELLEFQSSNSIIQKIKLATIDRSFRNLQHFKHISVVSESLREYINKTCSHLNACIYVNPCLASAAFTFSLAKRLAARKELGLADDDILLVFSSGGNAAWQNNNEIRRIDKRLKILNLSKVEIKQENIINKFVSYNEMPACLFAADVAVIFRDHSCVNKVASPVKFAEYACAGLPVISNGNVDQVREFISGTGFGAHVNHSEEITPALVEELIKLPRQPIAEKGKLFYGIKRVSETYLSIYHQMLRT